MFPHHQSIALASAIALGLAVAAPAAAQNVPKGSGWGARMMMEPIVMAHGGVAALCNPRAARLSGWGVDQIEKVLKPSESQRAALDELRAVCRQGCGSPALLHAPAPSRKIRGNGSPL